MDTTRSTYTARPFTKGGQDDLIAALNQAQRHHNEKRGEDESPSAISTSQVLQCLRTLGIEEGWDKAATQLFFGKDNYYHQDPPEDGGVETYGGLIFNDPEGKDQYLIRCQSRPSQPQTTPHIERRTDMEPPGGSWARRLKRWATGKEKLYDRTPSPSTFGQTEPYWSVTDRIGYYEVQPHFHENIGMLDIGPYPEHDSKYVGISALYPLEDKEDVDLHKGTVTFKRPEEAMDLARELEDVMDENGILCDPKVVLIATSGLALLPEDVKPEYRDYIRKKSNPEPENPNQDHVRSSAFLGRAYTMGLEHDPGHQVKRDMRDLVTDQRHANKLGELASKYQAFKHRSEDLESRFTDEAIPDIRKRDLQPDLDYAQATRDETRKQLADEAPALAGLILSLLEERRELVEEVMLGRMMDDNGRTER